MSAIKSLLGKSYDDLLEIMSEQEINELIETNALNICPRCNCLNDDCYKDNKGDYICAECYEDDIDRADMLFEAQRDSENSEA